MSHNKTYLITGANRGIGKALLKTYLSHPSTTVIAAVRTPDSPSTLNLQSLPTGPNSNLIIVKIDSNSETDAKAAITHLQTEHGIKKLDVVIANAGIASYNKSGETSPEQMREHFAINTIGPLVLFQACLPLLLPSGSSNSTSSESHTGETEQKGIFTAISSLVGSISSMGGLPLQSTAYGSSKAALNYVVRKIHFEYPDICAFVINPG
ncbi:MAG: hypothetical protein MMC33_006589, partial [Icmadophila ericetorum]|nr:hypothetical protein [Icmadophila ericetorum]